MGGHKVTHSFNELFNYYGHSPSGFPRATSTPDERTSAKAALLVRALTVTISTLTQ